MSAKKLSSLEALGSLSFENLAPDPDPATLPETQPDFKKQFLEAHFSNKGRGGKTVTIIKGFEGPLSDLKSLAKTLKQEIGVGGTVKNEEIIIQGNYRDVLMKRLIAMGHDVKRVGG